MEKKPMHRPSPYALDPEEAHTQSIRFLLNVINATIHSSGEDYEGALQEFFPQLQALGHLVGASSIDEVSVFLRRRRHWQGG